MCPCVPDWIGISKCWFLNWTDFIAWKEFVFYIAFFWGGEGFGDGNQSLFPQFVRYLVSVFRHRFLNFFDSRVHWFDFDRYQFEWHKGIVPLRDRRLVWWPGLVAMTDWIERHHFSFQWKLLPTLVCSLISSWSHLGNDWNLISQRVCAQLIGC